MTPNPYESPLTVSTLATEPPRPIWAEVEVEYELTIEDYIAFNMHHLRRSPSQRMLQVWVYLLLMIAVELANAVFLFNESFRGPLRPESLIIHLSFALLMPLILGILAYRTWRGGSNSWLTNRMLRSMLTQGDPSLMLGKRRVRVTPDVIEEISDLRESRLKLQCIQRIDVTPNYAFVYIAPVMAYILPVRAFVSPDHFATFIANLEGHTGKVAERFKK